MMITGSKYFAIYFLISLLFGSCSLQKVQDISNQYSAIAKQLSSDSLVIKGVFARNVGLKPGGRFSSIAVYEKDPKVFYLGSANGGLLKTTDFGRSFSFVLDKGGSANIGAVAISQMNPDIVYAGTGDPWQRNSAGRGDGIYKSIDGGKSWQHIGLENTNTIAKLIIHPQDNNIVFAAAMGSAWGYDKERGVYKTIDGGKSWKKVLYRDERSSAVDIIIDPKNPENMLAALWDHIHRPYGFYEGGSGSGIFKSTDGGNTWKKITEGLPVDSVGRIALAYFPKDPNNVAAIIQQPLGRSWVFRSKDGGSRWKKMRGEHYDHSGTKVISDHENFKKNGRIFWYRPYYNHVLTYHPTDVNCFYYNNYNHYTTDGGDSWKNGGVADFHFLWIDPSNPENYIQGSDHDVTGRLDCPIYTRVYPSLEQVYGVGYDMRKLYWVMSNAQDAFSSIGPSQSTTGESLSINDVYDFDGDEGGKPMADPKDWTRIYSSGRSLMLRMTDIKNREKKGTRIRKIHQYANPDEYEQYKKMDTAFRSNWNPGWNISPWNSKVIYFGGNYLFKSTDRGEHWKCISPDLTHNNPEFQKPDDGDAFHGDASESRQYQSITTVTESMVQQNLIWVGTDCGYVQLTKDGGKNWENLTKNIHGIPEYCWVSSIYPSRHKAGRAYVTFDNHKNGDINTYIYVTEDYGKSWTSIKANLPAQECCNVIKEGLKNPDLLYLGTEFSLWISLDRGKSWNRYQHFDVMNYKGGDKYFPTVAVADIEIHPRELDLIVGTHGRGIWILPARALEEMTGENRSKDVYFTEPGHVYFFPNQLIRPIALSRNNPRSPIPQELINRYINTQPGTLFSYYLKDSVKQQPRIKILADSKHIITDQNRKRIDRIVLTGPGRAGLNSIFWYAGGMSMTPGSYKVILTIEGKEYKRELIVEDVTDEILPLSKKGGN